MPRPRELLLAALAGAAAMLTFHQASVALLARYGLYPVEAFDISPSWLGLPQFLHGAAASAGFALVYRLVRARLPGPDWVSAPLFCAIVPIGFLFLVLAPARGAAIAFGMPPATIALVVLTHLVWGLGIAVWLRALEPGGHPRPR